MAIADGETIVSTKEQTKAALTRTIEEQENGAPTPSASEVIMHDGKIAIIRAKKHVNRCMVGYVLWKDAARRTCDPLLIGEGPTWEDAFADADRREAQGLPPLRMGFL